MEQWGSSFKFSWQLQFAVGEMGSSFNVQSFPCSKSWPEIEPAYRLTGLPGGRRAESKSELVVSSRFKFFIELAVAVCSGRNEFKVQCSKFHMFKVLTRLSLPGGRRAESKSDIIICSNSKSHRRLNGVEIEVGESWTLGYFAQRCR